MKNYQKIAAILAAIGNCEKSGNAEWKSRHGDTLKAIMDNAPSGSGIDCGTKLDDTATPEKLVFSMSFHHMNDGGFYDGWTEHKITVKASLQFGFTLSISGRDRNQIKDYLSEIYNEWLGEEYQG